jgi:hypothetical protein
MDANPLHRLMNDAAAAVAHDVSSRRHTGAATEVWSAESEVAALCASLAGTSSSQRAQFRAELGHRQRVVLGRFGVRSAAVAVRENSPARLRVGLIAIALEETNVDPRDLMLTVAPHHHLARQLGLAPAEIFDEAASFANPDTAAVLRAFGRRTDVTPEAFGFRPFDTPVGPQDYLRRWGPGVQSLGCYGWIGSRVGTPPWHMWIISIRLSRLA